MIANWKWLSLAVVVLVAIVGLRPLGDAEPGPGDEAVADGSGCAGHRPTPCMIEIRYAYPAGDLFVVPEEMIYF